MAHGFVVWEGPSRLDGSPIALIVTGFGTVRRKKVNKKTGPMLQSYILRRDMVPVEAVRVGLDTAICGGCRHRSVASGGLGSCYVMVAKGPHAVFGCYERGGYARVTPKVCAELIGSSGKGLRLGAYGDPAAVPVHIWQMLVRSAVFRTGYTHQWKRFPGLRGLVMASVDSVSESEEATRRGWKYFRIEPKGEIFSQRIRGEARCPASEEAGQKVTCATCPIKCDGVGSLLGRVIKAHGRNGKNFLEAV